MAPLSSIGSTSVHRSFTATPTRTGRAVSLPPPPFRNRASKCHRYPPTSTNRNPNPFERTQLSLSLDVFSTLFNAGGNVPFLPSLGLNAALFLVLRSKLDKVLTPEGFAHSLALGTLLWTTLGWRGWTICVLYLFLGSAVTKVRFAEKEKMGIAEGRGGRRGPENVWGSAATALLCAACSVQGSSFLGIGTDLYLLAYVSSLATKLSDTFASEIGKAYGKTTFLITTLEKVPPGTEGAVSAEGTAAALVGGSLLPLYAFFIQMISLPGVAVATVAAFLATNAESLIGATIQGKEGYAWMTNEVVNFFNTVIGAGLAIFGGLMFLRMT
eukprot:CAMPEP_0172517498 /NCGR_PEP_ID=MMETSP1066-20121228/285489_1 /TAXON_ID=671091 /ORGANISM="Coscinodiscus wailesii, Strain CCMP2513" /LENGTH=326 /DNA_ID=CAMNT_0013299521 /DNA_START=151 /DNA_END=1131 /DNA_ORIENTATION=+